MPVEANAKHVENLALQPIRRCPDRDRAGYILAVPYHRFHANSLVSRERIQNPDQIELFFPVGIVHRGDIHAVIKLLPVAQNLQDLRNNRRFDHHVILAQVSICFTDARAVLALECAHHRRFPRNWSGADRFCRRSVSSRRGGCFGLTARRRSRRLGFFGHCYEGTNLRRCNRFGRTLTFNSLLILCQRVALHRAKNHGRRPAAWYDSTKSRMRCASALRCPWLVIGSVPPVDSIRISDQIIPLDMRTDATCAMAMLSSLLPTKRGFTLLTCNAFTTIRVGKRKFPLVQRLATKVSPSEVALVIKRTVS